MVCRVQRRVLHHFVQQAMLSAGVLPTPCAFCPQEGFQRAKASVMTQPDPADPLRDCYGDAPLVQSRAPSGLQRTRIQDISTALDGQMVRLRNSTPAGQPLATQLRDCLAARVHVAVHARVHTLAL